MRDEGCPACTAHLSARSSADENEATHHLTTNPGKWHTASYDDITTQSDSIAVASDVLEDELVVTVHGLVAGHECA